jgi:hypothetical protein
MKFRIPIICSLLLAILSSCIKDEAPFREADITGFSLPASVMGGATYDNDIITVMLYDTAGFFSTKIAPQITVSEGATISPASGDSVIVKNYETTYKVTSENQSGSKTYTIRFVPFIPLKFDFEEWETKKWGSTKEYQVLKDPFWANANPGIAIVYPANTPFPTRSTTDSYSGEYAALLETAKGKRSILVNAPIFPGSLYRGKFTPKLSEPVTSAQFGQIHPDYAGKPVLFTGYYKYKPGELYQNENEEIEPGKIDQCDIYAVLFKVTKGAAGRDEYLDANEVNTIGSSNPSPKIVAHAILTDRTAKDKYTKFEIPFTYIEKLNYSAYDYKLAIVFSSSKDGAFFKGAIGSQLIIDEVEVKCTPIHQK